MQLYNSLTRQLQSVRPRNGRLSLYVCGITPYDVTHLGHAFTYTMFDVLRRYLEWQGVAVMHIQNVTDVDDDMVRKSRERGVSISELTRINVDWFNDDMRALGVLPPHHTPYASAAMPQIIELIDALLRRGNAYTAAGAVYFDVSSFPAYGRLSRLPREQMLAETRRHRLRAGPRDPLDFLLWQEEAAGEPAWDAPWGRGRPGWHIECSAMAIAAAGPSLDLHGGGHDLIFPHHESEIAQSESATGIAPYVHGWMHTGMIRYQGEKMSKSLGNLVLVKDLLRDHHPDAIRLSLLGIHYRDSQEWTAGELMTADQAAARLATALRHRDAAGAGPEVEAAPWLERFWAALAADLDTPRAVRALLELAGEVLRGAGRNTTAARAGLREAAQVLGLRGAA